MQIEENLDRIRATEQVTVYRPPSGRPQWAHGAPFIMVSLVALVMLLTYLNIFPFFDSQPAQDEVNSFYRTQRAICDTYRGDERAACFGAIDRALICINNNISSVDGCVSRHPQYALVVAP